MEENGMDRKKSEDMTIADHLAEHAQLMDQYEAASAAERSAAASCTSLRNTINGVQKRIDALLADVRKSSPIESDWGSSERKKLRHVSHGPGLESEQDRAHRKAMAGAPRPNSG